MPLLFYRSSHDGLFLSSMPDGHFCTFLTAKSTQNSSLCHLGTTNLPSYYRRSAKATFTVFVRIVLLFYLYLYLYLLSFSSFLLMPIWHCEAGIRVCVGGSGADATLATFTIFVRLLLFSQISNLMSDYYLLTTDYYPLTTDHWQLSPISYTYCHKAARLKKSGLGCCSVKNRRSPIRMYVRSVAERNGSHTFRTLNYF